MIHVTREMMQASVAPERIESLIDSFYACIQGQPKTTYGIVHLGDLAVRHVEDSSDDATRRFVEDVYAGPGKSGSPS